MRTASYYVIGNTAFHIVTSLEFFFGHDFRQDGSATFQKFHCLNFYVFLTFLLKCGRAALGIFGAGDKRSDRP